MVTPHCSIAVEWLACETVSMWQCGKPGNRRLIIIEMNPRCHASALLRKANRFSYLPKVAAKLRLVTTLDGFAERNYGMPHRRLWATIDYSSSPKSTFHLLKKFPLADNRLSTQMKSSVKHGHCRNFRILTKKLCGGWKTDGWFQQILDLKAENTQKYYAWINVCRAPICLW